MPPLEDTKAQGEFKTALSKTSAAYLLETLCVDRDIDLLNFSLRILAEKVLQQQGFLPQDGHYNDALINECIDAAVAAAFDKMPAAQRPANRNVDKDGNEQLTIDDELKKKAAADEKKRQKKNKTKLVVSEEEQAADDAEIPLLTQRAEDDPVDVESTEGFTVEQLPPAEAEQKDEKPKNKGGRPRNKKPPAVKKSNKNKKKGE